MRITFLLLPSHLLPRLLSFLTLPFSLACFAALPVYPLLFLSLCDLDFVLVISSRPSFLSGTLPSLLFFSLSLRGFPSLHSPPASPFHRLEHLLLVPSTLPHPLLSVPDCIEPTIRVCAEGFVV